MPPTALEEARQVTGAGATALASGLRAGRDPGRARRS